jgi:hypothetical protein
MFYEGNNPQIMAAKAKIDKDFGKALESGKAVVQPYTMRLVQFIKNGESTIELNTSTKNSVKDLADVEKLVDNEQHFYGYAMGYGVGKIPYKAENGVYSYSPGARLPFSYPNATVFNAEHDGIKELDAITSLFMSSIDFGRGYNSSMKNFDTSYFLSVPLFGDRAGIVMKDLFKTLTFDGASNKIVITIPKADRRLQSGLMTGVSKSTTGSENVLFIEMAGFLVSTGTAV